MNNILMSKSDYNNYFLFLIKFQSLFNIFCFYLPIVIKLFVPLSFTYILFTYYLYDDVKITNFII